ncbi:unnamed protein product [Musa hybrid cultivar]
MEVGEFHPSLLESRVADAGNRCIYVSNNHQNALYLKWGHLHMVVGGFHPSLVESRGGSACLQSELPMLNGCRLWLMM